MRTQNAQHTPSSTLWSGTCVRIPNSPLCFCALSTNCPHLSPVFVYRYTQAQHEIAQYFEHLHNPLKSTRAGARTARNAQLYTIHLLYNKCARFTLTVRHGVCKARPTIAGGGSGTEISPHAVCKPSMAQSATPCYVHRTPPHSPGLFVEALRSTWIMSWLHVASPGATPE